MERELLDVREELLARNLKNEMYEIYKNYHKTPPDDQNCQYLFILILYTLVNIYLLKNCLLARRVFLTKEKKTYSLYCRW